MLKSIFSVAMSACKILFVSSVNIFAWFLLNPLNKYVPLIIPIISINTTIIDIINEYKEKSQNAITELENLLTEEKIAENINSREISTRKDYYVELYNSIMLSDAMKKQYNSLEEKIKDEKSKLTEKVNQIDKIAEFLKKNSDAWTIKDDKIQFTNLNRMTEYYGLLNKLTD